MLFSSVCLCVKQRNNEMFGSMGLSKTFVTLKQQNKIVRKEGNISGNSLFSWMLIYFILLSIAFPILP